MGDDRVTRGRWAETIAACFLQLRGYRILDRNVRLGPLELDLICRKAHLLVVVEVRYRSGGRSGTASDTIDPRKQLRLETATVRYVRSRGLRDVSIRFDVMTLDGRGDELQVRHRPGAFPASGRYRL